SSLYQPPELLEVALNRHLVETNRIALEATPFNGKAAVRAYLLKWDIHNIELVLSSKSMGRQITETEPFLVSSRNFPAAISAGNISHDEMKMILSQPTVEAVVNQLVKYSYGPVLLRHLDAYQKTGDLGPMMSDLRSYYFTSLLESLRFFQGDEGVMRDLVRMEIDKKNIMSLLKGQESNLDKEVVAKHLVEGGHLKQDELLDIFGSKNTAEFVARIEGRFAIANMMTAFLKTHSLIDFELALDKVITLSYVRRLKNVALSIGTIFYFIITAEHEWDNIKRIAYGKRYELSNDRIASMLLFERE
ncbi:MAG TPA: V-type ATPase subunit, partial [Nitrososphaera sp.]|nr:V-type ATPase subunit [Nitrososphaera sp.]